LGKVRGTSRCEGKASEGIKKGITSRSSRRKRGEERKVLCGPQGTPLYKTGVSPAKNGTGKKGKESFPTKSPEGSRLSKERSRYDEKPLDTRRFKWQRGTSHFISRGKGT